MGLVFCLRFSVLFVIWTCASLISAQDSTESTASLSSDAPLTTPRGSSDEAIKPKEERKVTSSPMQETTIISIVHKNSGSVVVSTVPSDQSKASTESLLSRWNYNPYRSTAPRRRTPAGFYSITSPMPPASSTKKTSLAATRSSTTKSMVLPTNKKALLTMTMEFPPEKPVDKFIDTSATTKSAYRTMSQETTTPRAEEFSTWRSTSDNFITTPTSTSTTSTSTTTTTRPTTTTQQSTTTTQQTTTTTTTTQQPTTTTTTTQQPTTTTTTQQPTTTTTHQSTTATQQPTTSTTTEKPSTTTTTERATPSTTTTNPTTTTTKRPPTTATTTVKTTTTEKATTTTQNPDIPNVTTEKISSTRQYKDSLDKFLHDLSNRVSSSNVDTSSFYDRLNALLASSDIVIKPTTTESIVKKPNWWERHPSLQFSVLSAETTDDEEDYIGHRPGQVDIYNSQELAPPIGHPSFITSGSYLTKKPLRVSTRRPVHRQPPRRPPVRVTTKKSSVRTTPRRTTRRPTTTEPTTTPTTTTEPPTTTTPTTTTTTSTRRPAFQRITTSRATTTTTTEAPTTVSTTPEPANVSPVESAVPSPIYAESEESNPLPEGLQTTTRQPFEFESAAGSEQSSFVVINIWQYSKGHLKLMGQQSIPSPTAVPASSHVSLSDGNVQAVWPPDLPQSVLNQIIVSIKAVNQSLNPFTTEAPTTLSPPPGGVGNPSLSGSFKPHHYTTPLPIQKIQQQYGAPPAANPPAADPTPPPVFVSPLAQLLSQTYGFAPAKQVPGSAYVLPPPAPSAIPMNPVVAKNLSATLGGTVQSIPIAPASGTDYVPSAVSIPAPQDSGGVTLFGYNAPPLNAILPDYIAERLPHARYSPENDTTESSGELLSRQFASVNNFEHNSKSGDSSDLQLSYNSPYLQPDFDVKHRYGPSFPKPIEAQVPPSFYSVLATRNYPGTTEPTTTFSTYQYGEIAGTTSPQVAQEVTTVATTVDPSKVTTQRRILNGQRKTLLALGLSMLPTFVMAVPAIGKKRSMSDDPLGRFLENYPILEAKYDALKYLGAEGLRQMRGNGIPIRNCKSTVYQDETQLSRRALICPGRAGTDINVILLDDLA